MKHQALLLGDDERGWTYVSKDGAVGGGAFGASEYTIAWFPTFNNAMGSPELTRYDQALMHVPEDISRENVNAMTDAVLAAATSIVTENYNFVSNNCGDLVRSALTAAQIVIPVTVNPQASVNNMENGGRTFTNRSSGDIFIDITPENRRAD